MKRNRMIHHAAMIGAMILIGILDSCNSGTTTKQVSEKRMVIDMGGRHINVKPIIRKVACNGSSGAILLYTLADDLMIARNGMPSEGERQYCTTHYCNLINIGSWFNTSGSRNNEEIIVLEPDVIISAGKVDSATIKIVDNDQALLNIPMYLASTEIAHLPETYEQLGKLLNREEKAEELIAFYHQYVSLVLFQYFKLAPTQKKRVYVAMDNDGLTTPPARSLHSQVIEMAGAVNVAQLNYPNADIRAHAKVTIEQVIKWDPEIILISDCNQNRSSEIRRMIQTNPKWQGIRAIKENQIIEVPSQPFVWIDRPPSVNQVIGLLWLAKLLYPQMYKYKTEDVVVEFFKKFYHRNLTMDEVGELLDKY